LLAAVLLTAAALKAYQLATEPVIGKGLLDSRWLLAAAVEFEIFASLWLLSNNVPALTWLATLGLFNLFTVISLYKALVGYSSCGCFGAAKIWPGYTAAADLAIVLSLLRWRPSDQQSPVSVFRLLWPFSTLHSSFSIRRASAVLVIWLLAGRYSRCLCDGQLLY
jgi:hypothetical protein